MTADTPAGMDEAAELAMAVYRSSGSMTMTTGVMQSALTAALPALTAEVERLRAEVLALVHKAEQEGPFLPGEWDGQPAVLVDDLRAILGEHA